VVIYNRAGGPAGSLSIYPRHMIYIYVLPNTPGPAVDVAAGREDEIDRCFRTNSTGAKAMHG
jgi:hypothetical protein